MTLIQMLASLLARWQIWKWKIRRDQMKDVLRQKGLLMTTPINHRQPKKGRKILMIKYLCNKKDCANATYDHQSVHGFITSSIKVGDVMNVAVMSRLVVDQPVNS